MNGNTHPRIGTVLFPKGVEGGVDQSGSWFDETQGIFVLQERHKFDWILRNFELVNSRQPLMEWVHPVDLAEKGIHLNGNGTKAYLTPGKPREMTLRFLLDTIKSLLEINTDFLSEGYANDLRLIQLIAAARAYEYKTIVQKLLDIYPKLETNQDSVNLLEPELQEA